MLTYRCPAPRLPHWTASSPRKFGNEACLLFMLRSMLATPLNEQFSPKSLSCLEHRSWYKMRDQSLRRRLCGLCSGRAWSRVSSGLRLLLWSLNANHMSLLLVPPPTKVLNSPENQARGSNALEQRQRCIRSVWLEKITSLMLWQNSKLEGQRVRLCHQIHTHKMTSA